MENNKNDNNDDLEMCFAESLFLLAENIVFVPVCPSFIFGVGN